LINKQANEINTLEWCKWMKLIDVYVCLVEKICKNLHENTGYCEFWWSINLHWMVADFLRNKEDIEITKRWYVFDPNKYNVTAW
jgi:hypothetical protein